jgi:hypothetical protein
VIVIRFLIRWVHFYFLIFIFLSLFLFSFLLDSRNEAVEEAGHD